MFAFEPPKAADDYLDLLPTKHCQFSHVPEGLQQVLVELRGGLQQATVGLILLLVQLQQLHHAVGALVFLQQLHFKAQTVC